MNLTAQEVAQLREAMEKQKRLRELYGIRLNLKSSSPVEDIKSIIPNLTASMGAVKSDNPALARFSPPAPVRCKHCGRELYWRGIVNTGPDGATQVFWLPGGPEQCDCKAAVAERKQKELAEAEELAKQVAAKKAAETQRRIEKLFGECGMGSRFKRRTFSTFQETPNNTKALGSARGYARNFTNLATAEQNGLLFVGSKGTGKTHLAAAIANQLISEGVPVLFITMIDLLAKIKATFNGQSPENEEKLMRLYKNVDLLILDDMGKELPTPWALSKIFELVNARYENYKPVIVTSNYTPAELVNRLTPPDGDVTTADATVDRLLEMTYTIPLAGESWRTK